MQWPGLVTQDGAQRLQIPWALAHDSEGVDKSVWVRGKLRRRGEQAFPCSKTGCIPQVLLSLLSCCELNRDFAASYPKAREKPEIPILCGFPRHECYDLDTTCAAVLVDTILGFQELLSPPTEPSDKQRPLQPHGWCLRVDTWLKAIRTSEN